MTDEQDIYVCRMVAKAGSILAIEFSYGDIKVLSSYEVMTLQVNILRALMDHFPFHTQESTAGPAKPDAAGNWLYRKQGDSEYMAVSVDEKDGVFRYYNQESCTWVAVNMAKGEWGGRFE